MITIELDEEVIKEVLSVVPKYSDQYFAGTNVDSFKIVTTNILIQSKLTNQPTNR